MSLIRQPYGYPLILSRSELRKHGYDCGYQRRVLGSTFFFPRFLRDFSILR